MSFVIQASPLTKIFCFRDWQLKCLADPSLISNSDAFSVTIPRSAGAITLRHKIPVDAATLLPRLSKIHNKSGSVEVVQTRVQGDDELRNLIPWLTGGPDGQQYMETDRWGVVELPLVGDYMTMQAEFMSQEAMLAVYPEKAAEVETYRKKIQAKMRAAMGDAMKRAMELSHERVMRAVKSVYRNFYEQNKTNLENGIGRVTPTDAEKLVAYMLHEQIQKRNESQKDMMDKVRQVISHNVVGA